MCQDTQEEPRTLAHTQVTRPVRGKSDPSTFTIGGKPSFLFQHAHNRFLEKEPGCQVVKLQCLPQTRWVPKLLLAFKSFLQTNHPVPSCDWISSLLLIISLNIHWIVYALKSGPSYQSEECRVELDSHLPHSQHSEFLRISLVIPNCKRLCGAGRTQSIGLQTKSDKYFGNRT